MYEFLRGPMVCIAFLVCVLGLLYQFISLLRLTSVKEHIFYSSKAKKKNRNLLSEESLSNLSIKIKGTILGTEPFVVILTTLFHICIIITPLFLMGHNILMYESWSFSLYSFSESFTDFLTLLFLVCAAIFLLRRIFIARVRAVTGIYDLILLLITIAPFLTGYMAYHQLINYETIITIHILVGEIMLMAIGLTKLGHAVFFFFARLLIGSEYSFSGGSRAWKLKI